MFGSIVVGVDGSPTAQHAFEKALELARLCDATLHIVTAYQDPKAAAALAMTEPFAASALVASLPDDAFAGAAAEVLAGARKQADGIACETYAVAGDAADAILDVAQSASADLIVVGNKGMRGARRFLGSIPNHVAHHAPCAVMIVHTT